MKCRCIFSSMFRYRILSSRSAFHLEAKEDGEETNILAVALKNERTNERNPNERK